MIEVYFENGPLAGQIKEVKAGAVKYWHLELSPVAPSDGARVKVSDSNFNYYRVGRKHEGLPVFRCTEAK